MDITLALQIVLDLARGNICDEHMCPSEYATQIAACDAVEDMAVNQFGDE